MKSALTFEETNALTAAVKIHGRKAKSAIRQAWYNGNYDSQCLGEYSSTLQNLRNRDGGTDALSRAKLKFL